MKTFEIQGKVHKYEGPGAWFFVNIPKNESEQIRNTKGLKKVGWGYVKVRATIGKSAWETTLFPSKRDAVYLIVIKADIRRREGIDDGDTVDLKIALL